MTVLAGSWLAHLLQSLWQGTAVAVVILVVVRLFRRSDPRLRQALVGIALLKFVIPPMLPLPTGLFSVAPPAPHIAPVSALVRSAMQPEARPLLFALLLLHVTGAGFALLRLAVEVRRLRGIRARAMSQGDWLVSDEVRAPMTVGIFRPAMLLPTTLPRALTERELEDVLAHESEHVRRRDVLRNLIQELVIALWWFHPLVHRLARDSRAIREECCDDALLASGRCEKAQYARTLLQAATFAAREGRTVAAIAESPHELLRRVRRIADRQFVPSRRLGLAAMLAIVLFALTLLPGLRISAGNRFAFDHATRHALHHRH